MNTIFDPLGIDRTITQWETLIPTLTPWTRGNGRWYKREDFFAPLGYGGPNGSKLRQLVFLIGNYVRNGGTQGIVTGASVLSPQLSMAALVARHYGLRIHIVLGGTKPETAFNHPNVRIAKQAGADFTFIKVGYNPALQKAVTDIANANPGWYQLHYGITTPTKAGDAELEAFHAIGAHQLSNIPDTITDLAITCGSANSCTSLLYGIALHQPKNLQRIALLGIGPTRIEWFTERLHRIERHTGVPILTNFRRQYHHHPELNGGDGQYLLEHYDLHTTKYASYGDKMPFTTDGIDFHPTYEGKALTYMRDNANQFSWWWDSYNTAGFWIVGSTPNPATVEPYLPTGTA